MSLRPACPCSTPGQIEGKPLAALCGEGMFGCRVGPGALTARAWASTIYPDGGRMSTSMTRGNPHHNLAQMLQGTLALVILQILRRDPQHDAGSRTQYRPSASRVCVRTTIPSSVPQGLNLAQDVSPGNVKTSSNSASPAGTAETTGRKFSGPVPRPQPEGGQA